MGSSCAEGRALEGPVSETALTDVVPPLEVGLSCGRDLHAGRAKACLVLQTEVLPKMFRLKIAFV